MIELAPLLPLQADLRHPETLAAMVAHVRAGGRWDAATLAAHGGSTTLITVSRLDDGVLLLRDGHHRAVATLLAGRGFLDDEEYLLDHHTYADYATANVADLYVTPLDVRTECRAADFYASIRTEALSIAAAEGEPAAVAFIHAHRDRYIRPRRFATLAEFARHHGPVAGHA